MGPSSVACVRNWIEVRFCVSVSLAGTMSLAGMGLGACIVEDEGLSPSTPASVEAWGPDWDHDAGGR